MLELDDARQRQGLLPTHIRLHLKAALAAVCMRACMLCGLSGQSGNVCSSACIPHSLLSLQLCWLQGYPTSKSLNESQLQSVVTCGAWETPRLTASRDTSMLDRHGKAVVLASAESTMAFASPCTNSPLGPPNLWKSMLTL